MIKDIFAVFAVDVECERIFNIAEFIYDHRKHFASKIFLILMMLRLYEQKENEAALLHVDLNIEKKITLKKLKKKNTIS